MQNCFSAVYTSMKHQEADSRDKWLLAQSAIGWDTLDGGDHGQLLFLPPPISALSSTFTSLGKIHVWYIVPDFLIKRLFVYECFLNSSLVTLHLLFQALLICRLQVCVACHSGLSTASRIVVSVQVRKWQLKLRLAIQYVQTQYYF